MRSDVFTEHAWRNRIDSGGGMRREVWLLLDSRGVGGIETHVAELAVGLAAAGELPRVLFLADYGPHPMHERLARAGLCWETLDGGLPGLVRRLKRDRPRVLHTHGYKANILGRVAALLAGVPVIASYHAGERPPGRLAAYLLIDRWTSFLGKRIAVSRQILASLPFGGVLVPNFVAVPAGPPCTGPETIGFVGRMLPDKGPDRFCDIAARLPGGRFVAYGDGPMRAQIERDGGRVSFKGAVSGMDDAWSSIGLLVISSRAEGLPLAALEAMAHGVPVAAFALGGLPELIENDRNGYLAPPDDVAALSACVARWMALDAAGRDAIGRAAWQTVTARYGQAAGVAAIRALYPAG
jgi:glycosyltransferase involved in cell wall biosynthesis